MNCKGKLLVWLAMLGVLGTCAGLQAQTADGVRNIKLNEDRDQRYMVSKVYELKNIGCEDITPWITGAVYRYNVQSTVNRLEYKQGNKKFIVVTTGRDMMPYIDAMVAAMDRPCGKTDAMGSIVDGSGIYKFFYRPKYRANDEMIATVVRDCRSDGYGWYEANNNYFYWKDSKSDGETVLKWLKAIDRPVPQVALRLNVYEVTDNNFRELGIDWVNWKNGPGATLFGAGYDLAKYQGTSELMSQTLGSMSGFMFAPQFDSTFIKMLQEKGKARSATSGSLTLINDYTEAPASFATAKYKISFNPSYEAIQKNSDRVLSVAADGTANFQLYLLYPTICYGPQGDKANFIRAGFNLTVVEAVDQTNTDTTSLTSVANVAYDYQSFVTYTSLATDSEKLIATYTKDHKVTQNMGIPYLCDIPGLKYIFGSTSESVNHTRVFVTVSASPVSEGSNYSDWAGKIIEAASLPEAK